MILNVKNKSRGFTLIELLVVMSIIGMLASTVFASVDAARSKARDARRMADIKHISDAILAYGYDHGYYPYQDLYSPAPFNWGYNYSDDPTFLSSLVGGYVSLLPLDPINDHISRGFWYGYINNDGNVGGPILNSVQQTNFAGLDCLGVDPNTIGAILVFISENVLPQYTHANGLPKFNTICYPKL